MYLCVSVYVGERERISVRYKYTYINVLYGARQVVSLLLRAHVNVCVVFCLCIVYTHDACFAMLSIDKFDKTLFM